jgi:hypothetical protein
MAMLEDTQPFVGKRARPRPVILTRDAIDGRTSVARAFDKAFSRPHNGPLSGFQVCL